MTKLEVLAVVAMVGILLALFLPALSNAHRHPPGLRCLSNLKQIGLSERMWSLDHGDKFPWEVSTNNGGTKEWLAAGLVHLHYQALSNELSSPKILVCRADTNKTETNTFSQGLGRENVSFFVGISARESLPNTIMGGDPYLVAKEPLASGTHALTGDQKLTWNETYHAGNGAVVLTDGSVHLTKKKDLQRLLKDSGIATNWIVLP